MVNLMVERATSSQLIGPDWAINLEICDMLNHEPGQAKDVVKGIKKRMGTKNPKVQLLTLTLLETVVKNCGDVVHMHVAEKDIPHEMVKIAKKKPDFQVKEKILTLINTWQEAFGGPRARYPQYFAAYQELLRAGSVFPRKSESSAPVFTPPQTQPLSSYPPNYRNLNSRKETAEASSEAEYPSLSLTEIQNARGIMDVLFEMLSAIDPANKESLRQEVVVDLVEQCRTYKQRVVHLVNSTSDESLLCQGLALNDDLQKVLARHEALVSGTVVPQQKSKPESSKSIVDANSSTLVDTGESSKQTEARSATGETLSAAPVSGSTATPPPKADLNFDLLSGDLLGDDCSSSAPQDALALVPVSAPQPMSPVANHQNALALFDMFSTPTSSNSYPGAPDFQQQQNLQVPQSGMPYANGMATNNKGSAQYEQSGGYPQAAGSGWNHQVSQQQPQSPSAFGAFNAQQQPQAPSPASYGALNAQVAQQQPQAPSPAAYGAFNAQVAQQQPQPQPQPQPQSQSQSPAAYGAFNVKVAQQQPQPQLQSQLVAYGASNTQVVQQPQQQSQSPVYGAQNGGAFPPPPWESQAADINQPFSSSHNQPFSPSHNQPFSPSQNHPFSPSHSQPFSPSHSQPFSPSYSQPFSPTHNQPFSPSYSQPFSPNHSQPFAPSQPYSHNQPFSPQYSPAMSAGGQQSPTFHGGLHPFAPQPTGNDRQVSGMYAQQQMTGSHMPGMNAQHMSNQMPSMYPQPYQGGPGPMMSTGPQTMQGAQMAQMYGNQMSGYGYGYAYAHAQPPDFQYLDQRMYGLSLRDDSSPKLGSSQSSMASYLPPMKQQTKGEDNLFGDLVDMAKLKPTNPTRTGSV